MKKRKRKKELESFIDQKHCHTLVKELETIIVLVIIIIGIKIKLENIVIIHVKTEEQHKIYVI